MESYLDRIKLIKNEKKMTNDQLSERTGIPLGTLMAAEHGLNLAIYRPHGNSARHAEQNSGGHVRFSQGQQSCGYL